MIDLVEPANWRDVERAVNLILRGQLGTCKPMLAVALGIKAIEAAIADPSSRSKR
jgi:hypothetical protein